MGLLFYSMYNWFIFFKFFYHLLEFYIFFLSEGLLISCHAEFNMFEIHGSPGVYMTITTKNKKIR